MASDHYSNLGVGPEASQDEIRAAYRQLAREFHPDLNKSDGAPERFLSIKESYETLSNPDRKEVYDRFRGMKAERVEEKKEERKREESNERVQTAGYFRGRKAWEDDSRQEVSKEEFMRRKSRVAEMQKLAARGRWGEAAVIANELVGLGMQEASAHGVLGDAARLRGEYMEAARHYGFAVQFDPRNETYQEMHVAMMDGSKRVKPQVKYQSEQQGTSAFLLGLIVVVAAICYTAVAKEVALVPEFGAISTWTLGQIGMMLVAGVAMGASLSASDLMDHFDLGGGTAGYRFHPGVMIGLISLVSFWVGAAVYVLVGVTQKSFHASLSRLVGYVSVGTVGFGLARFSLGWEAVAQTIIWAGSILYLAGLVGWLVADSLRRV